MYHSDPVQGEVTEMVVEEGGADALCRIEDDESDVSDADSFVVEDEASGASDFDHYGEGAGCCSGGLCTPAFHSDVCANERGADSGDVDDDDDDVCADDEYGGGPNHRRRMAETIEERASAVPIVNNRRAAGWRGLFSTRASGGSFDVSSMSRSTGDRMSPSKTKPSYRNRPRTGAGTPSSSSGATARAQFGVDVPRMRRFFRIEKAEFTGSDHRPCFTFHGLIVEGPQSESSSNASSSNASSSSEAPPPQQRQRILDEGLTLSVRFEPPSPKFSHKCPGSASYRLKVARGSEFLYSTRGMEKSLFVDFDVQHLVWGDLELHFLKPADLRRFTAGLKHVKQEDVTGMGILLGAGESGNASRDGSLSHWPFHQSASESIRAGLKSWSAWVTSTAKDVSRGISSTNLTLLGFSVGLGALALVSIYANTAGRRRSA